MEKQRRRYSGVGKAACGIWIFVALIGARVEAWAPQNVQVDDAGNISMDAWAPRSTVTLHLDGGSWGKIWGDKREKIESGVKTAIGAWKATGLTFVVASLPALPADGNVDTPAEYLSLTKDCTDGLNPVIYDDNGSILGSGQNGLGLDIFVVAGLNDSSCPTVDGTIRKSIVLLNGKFFDDITKDTYVPLGCTAGKTDCAKNPREPEESNGTEGDASLIRILMHEFGHFLGIGHSQVNGQYFLKVWEDGQSKVWEDGQNDPGFQRQVDPDLSRYGAPPRKYVEIMFPFNVSEALELQMDDLAAVDMLYPPERKIGGYSEYTVDHKASVFGDVSNDVGGRSGVNVIIRDTEDPYKNAISHVTGDLIPKGFNNTFNPFVSFGYGHYYYKHSFLIPVVTLTQRVSLNHAFTLEATNILPLSGGSKVGMFAPNFLAAPEKFASDWLGGVDKKLLGNEGNHYSIILDNPCSGFMQEIAGDPNILASDYENYLSCWIEGEYKAFGTLPSDQKWIVDGAGKTTTIASTKGEGRFLVLSTGNADDTTSWEPRKGTAHRTPLFPPITGRSGTYDPASLSIQMRVMPSDMRSIAIDHSFIQNGADAFAIFVEDSSVVSGKEIKTVKEIALPTPSTPTGFQTTRIPFAPWRTIKFVIYDRDESLSTKSEDKSKNQGMWIPGGWGDSRLILDNIRFSTQEVFRPSTTDLDTDADGVLDLDTDADDAIDTSDNCKNTQNLDQLDADGDKIGDVCDLEPMPTPTPSPTPLPTPTPRPTPTPIPTPTPRPTPTPTPTPITCDGLPATIFGTAGNDTLTGTSGPDVISGLGGNDTIKGQGGDDTICGEGGKDRIYGGSGKDNLFGGSGNDRIYGGPGKDGLYGGRGRDSLDGGSGRDFCNGGSGRDTATRCEKKKSIP